MNCHTDLKISSTLREFTPDLSSAGLRYNSGYLFDFLKNPVKVRQHIGSARMPDFHLTEKEAVALVRFLETQRQITGRWPELPIAIKNQLDDKPQPVSRQQFDHLLGGGLLCLTCHTLEGKGGNRAVELANVSYRLQPAWMKSYLVAPSMFGVPHHIMPAQFYERTNDGKGFEETNPQAALKIRVLTDYLFSFNGQKRNTLNQQYEASKAAFPDATTEVGKEIFIAFNCAACHRHQTLQPRLQDAAPDLTQSGKYAAEMWLQNYLKKPVAIRPFGYRPGEGSRMPDFRLSDEEAKTLTAFLSSRKQNDQLPLDFHHQKLSAFAKRKAKLLLTEKLSCLGCHTFEGQGGKIGPDLTQIRLRLQPKYVYNLIKDPKKVTPHSIMPQIPMREETVQLITNFLFQHDQNVSTPTYLSPAEYPLIPFDGKAADGKSNYLKYCAACHGNEGRGNGFNAKFLPTKPTMHADPKHMSQRPDDTLYDGIFSGGYILNKSHTMPPWGGSLPAGSIRELVRYLRLLCHCQGPSWSLDNQAKYATR